MEQKGDRVMRKHIFGKLAAAAVVVGGTAAAVSRLLKLREAREQGCDECDEDEFDHEAFSGKTERTYVPLTPKATADQDTPEADSEEEAAEDLLNENETAEAVED